MHKLILPILLALAAIASTPPAAAATDADCDTVSDMTDRNVKEVFQVAGDGGGSLASDTRALRGGALGSSVLDAGRAVATPNALGHPQCIYSFGQGGEMVVEIDVYQLANQPMRLHLLCPHCYARGGERNGLNVTSDRKQMDYDPAGVVPPFPGWSARQMREAYPNGAGGLLSVSTRFRCAWEVDARYRQAIGNICDFEVVIDKNVIRRVSRAAGGSLLGTPRAT